MVKRFDKFEEKGCTAVGIRHIIRVKFSSRSFSESVPTSGILTPRRGSIKLLLSTCR